jgi:uncharacterized protein YndB with AHSA1/START domain
MDQLKFVYVTYIDAPLEKVWAALTQPEFTRQYYGGRSIQSEWTTGASIKFLRPDGGIDLVGEVLEIAPPRLLSCTYHDAPGRHDLPPEAPSRLTFEVTAAHNVTKLTVTHDQFQPGSTLIHHVTQGWQMIFSSLKTLLETGKALPFVWD